MKRRARWATFDGDLLMDVVVTQRDSNALGSMHAFSQNHRRLHFGLGPHLLADLSARWPSGIVQILKGVDTDQVHRVTEPPAE